MRLIILGIVATTLAGGAMQAQAQGNWQPQTVPSPAPLPYPVLGIVSDKSTVLPCGPSSKTRRSCAQPALPSGNPGLWISNDDMPTRALREGREGRVGFRLQIGKDGKPFECVITERAEFEEFNTLTCDLLMQRAVFYPALNDYGKPTVGTWSSRMNFSQPDH